MIENTKADTLVKNREKLFSPTHEEYWKKVYFFHTPPYREAVSRDFLSQRKAPP